MHIYLLAALLLPQPSLSAPEKIIDPYKTIETITLANGMKVVLAPSATADTVEINMQVKAGQRDDAKGKAGTAHLLEHFLFQDPALKSGTTYLDLIKEKGGYANGVTKFDETEYYATVEKAHAHWIVDVFGKILLKKTFTASDVERAKKPVYLEIGQPGPWDYFNQMKSPALVKFLHVPTFWEREFGIEEDHGPRLRGSDSIDTAYIQAKDLEQFYAQFYGPSNVTLFVAGGFDLASTKAQLKAIFGNEPTRPAPIRDEPKLVAKIRPYTTINLTTEVPRVEVGAKIVEFTAADSIVANIYLGHLAHRLMKDLRNVRGETYTVMPNFHLHRRHGYATIQFETSVDQYRHNLDFVRDQIFRETQGGTSQEQFEEARQFFGKRFKLNEKDAGSMMGQAKYLTEFRENYPEVGQQTPFAVYSGINHDTYMATIKKLFRPEMAYEDRLEPPQFFRYDPVVFTFLAFCLWMLVSRLTFARKFSHDRIRWVRKIRYFPAYVIQIGSLALGLFLITIAVGSLQKFWNETGLSQQPALVSYYAKSIFEMAAIVLSLQLTMMLFARKVMVVGDSLWVKTLGYWSYRYPLQSIHSVELMHPLRVLFSPALLYRTGFRFFYYFDPKFWNKGILVRLKNKKCVFLCVTEPNAAIQELREFLVTREPVLQLAHDSEAA